LNYIENKVYLWGINIRTMTMKTFKKLLIKLRACNEAREWAGDMTIEQVVEKCHRGDWLLWLARNIEVDERKRYLAAGYCANTVRHLMDDVRSLAAVDAAIAYGEGKISKDELVMKRDDSCNAYDTAFYAARAADDVATSGAGAVAAAGAAYAAVYAGFVYAGRAIWIKTANICRKYLGEEIITKVNQML